MDEIEKLVGELGDGYSVSWYGISYEEKQTGGKATNLYLLSLLIVFLSLAALYESWTVPFDIFKDYFIGDNFLVFDRAECISK